MGFAVTVGIYVGLFILSKALAKDEPKASKAKPNDSVAVPPEGSPLPLWWGRVRFSQPALVWNSPRAQDPGNDWWKMHMMLILGIPMEGSGAGGSTLMQLESFFLNGVKLNPDVAGRRTSFAVAITDTTSEMTDPEVSSYFIYNNDLGNNPDIPVRGTIVLEAGCPSLGSNSLIGSYPYVVFGEPFPAAPTENHWPRFEGQTKVFLSDNTAFPRDAAPTSGFAYTTITADPSGSLPAMEFDVYCKVTHDFGGGRPLVKSLPSGDANPAGVIYDVLTSKWGKLGLPVSSIDLDSFAEAGETLYAENHGYSFVLYDTVEAKDFILDILKQIDAVLYEDPATRKLVLSLTRPDYVIGDLPEFDETNITEMMSFSTSTFDETFNEVRVLYTDRQLGYKQSTAVAQDMANLTSQGGRVRSVTREYLGVTTERLAAMLAARDLREVSVPLASVTFKVNRDGWVTRPNGCLKLSWADFNGMTDSVFRVIKVDSGTLEDSQLVVTAIQDIFSVTEGLMTPPEIMPIATVPPRAIERRIFTEAPRWFLRKAVARGINTDINTPRGYYLGARPEVASSQYLMRLGPDTDDDTAGWLKTDRWMTNYPYIHGVVETAYSRTADPYDTSTGLRITLDSFSYLPNFTATAAEIAQGKRNIVYVGGEIIAFETLTFISGFTWRLDDVWRGLLDTVPVAHAVGEPVFFLSYGNQFNGDFLTGNAHDFSEDPVLKAAMLPLTNGTWMKVEDDAVEFDSLVVRGRTLLPYPAANITIEGTKGTARREEEGFALGWKRRNLNYTSITRGDDASQIVTSTQYWIYAQKIGPNVVGEEKLIGVATSADEALEVAAAEAGCGTLAVFPRTVDLATNFTNWQDPQLPVEFPCWRVLTANCRFVDDFGSNVTQPWIITAGDVTRHSDSLALGGNATSWYAAYSGDGESPAIDFYQDIFIAGWYPTNQSALLTFYRRRTTGDTDDFLQVDLVAYDSDGVQLDIDTHGPTNPGTAWTRTQLNIANMDPATHKLRVRVQMTYIDEPPTHPDVAITEIRLYVGQIGLFLTNDSFTSDLSSWTIPTGTFTRQTANPYTGAGYARGGTGTTNEMYQDVTLPGGFEMGTVVLDFAQGDEGGADNDLGYIQIDARDSGGGVLASANTPAVKAVTTTGTWIRKRLVLENIPYGTTVLRVRLIATRTAAGTADATFADLEFKLFKEQNPDYKLDLSVTTPPSTRFPKTGSAWYDAYPSVPPPDFMLYDGEKLEGQVGIEANLATPSTPYLGKLIGPYDGDHDTWSSSCYDFRPGCQALEAIDDGAGYFANFAAGEAFTVVAIVRPGHGNTTTRRICGRIDGTTGGWCLEHLATGRFQAKIRSGVLTWNASPTLVTLPGGLYCVQMSYNPALGQLRCAVNDGSEVTTSVTVGTSIKAANDLLFRIGKAEASDTLWNGQVARLYGWRTAHANFMPSMNTYGDKPTGISQSMTCSQTGQVMARLGDDFDGVTMAVYNPGLICLGRQQGDWGYAMPAQVENNLPSRDLTDAAAFPPTSGSASITRVGIVTPTGEANGVRVTAAAVLEGLRVVNIPIGAGPDVHVYLFARTLSASPGDGGISVRLENTSGVLKGAANITVGPQWELYAVFFSSWDDSTANCQIEIVQTAGGTGPAEWDIGGPIILNQDSVVQYTLPYNELITQHQVDVDLTGITQQFNHEGEIYVEGTDDGVGDGPSPSGLAIDVHNGANNNDRRLYTISDGSGSFSHYNASGTVATGTSGAPTWDSNWSARARWNRLALLDSVTSWARSITSGTASSARAATFTASTTPVVELNMTGGVNGIVRRLILFAREVILGQDV